MSNLNQIELITYADSLGENLQDLNFVLNTYLKKVIAGVHILPFYPSSVDRGFGPLTHLQVDPRLGSWQDIEIIAKNFAIMADLIVNHISDQSSYFQDFLQKGQESEFAEMFLDVGKFFPGGEIDAEQMNKVYTRKPVLPIREIELVNGQQVKLWNTFFREQIDLDVNTEKTKEILASFIQNLASHGVKYLRLDALGYVTKKIGTKCFFEEPEIYEILAWFKEQTAKYDLLILPEIHLDYQTQQKLTDHGFYSYDFALPVLVLHALLTAKGEYLKNWLQIRPNRQFTVLDTHDGIGMIDVKGLLPEAEIAKTTTLIHENGGNNTLYATGTKVQNLDIYQINCTYYSALKQNDQAYLAARAIQFFTPGIPQIYYVGLLAEPNDTELMEKTNQGRDINRHYFSLSQIAAKMDQKVVRSLFKLMEFRNSYAAFDGDFELFNTSDNLIKLGWATEKLKTTLTVNLETYSLEIEFHNTMSNKMQILNLN